MVAHRTRERTLQVAEQLGLHQLLGDRAAVHRHEGAPPARPGVDGLGQHLLADPAFAAQHDGDRAGRDRLRAEQQILEGGRERGQPAAAPRQVGRLDVPRTARGNAAAKRKERPTHLRQALVSEVGAADGLAVHHDPVLRSDVADGEAFRPSADLGVGLRDPAVGQRDLEAAVGGDANGALLAAADPHHVHACERVARGTDVRTLALELEEQVRGARGLPRRLRVALGERVAGRGHAVKRTPLSVDAAIRSFPRASRSSPGPRFRVERAGLRRPRQGWPQGRSRCRTTGSANPLRVGAEAFRPAANLRHRRRRREPAAAWSHCAVSSRRIFHFARLLPPI